MKATHLETVPLRRASKGGRNVPVLRKEIHGAETDVSKCSDFYARNENLSSCTGRIGWFG